MKAISDTHHLYLNEPLKISHSRFDATLQKLRAVGEMQYHKKGQVLYNMGSIARGLYVIDSGKVKVSIFSADGKEQILQILKNNDLIGYQALLAGDHHHEYAELVEDAVLSYVSHEDFDTLKRTDPDVLDYFITLLNRELQGVRQMLVDTAYIPVRGRVAQALLDLSGVYDKDGHGITLSRGDLANMIGTAKETTIRLLSEFKRDGFITTRGQQIDVIDRDGLKKTVDLYR